MKNTLFTFLASIPTTNTSINRSLFKDPKLLRWCTTTSNIDRKDYIIRAVWGTKANIVDVFNYKFPTSSPPWSTSRGMSGGMGRVIWRPSLVRSTSDLTCPSATLRCVPVPTSVWGERPFVLNFVDTSQFWQILFCLFPEIFSFCFNRSFLARLCWRAMRNLSVLTSVRSSKCTARVVGHVTRVMYELCMSLPTLLHSGPGKSTPVTANGFEGFTRSSVNGACIYCPRGFFNFHACRALLMVWRAIRIPNSLRSWDSMIRRNDVTACGFVGWTTPWSGGCCRVATGVAL